MDRLILPLVFMFPLFSLASAYRIWQLIEKRLIFTNRVIAAFYMISIFIVSVGWVYIGWHFYQCVWPNRCGEGFASGYVVASVLLGAGVMSIAYIVTEVVLFFAVRKNKLSSHCLIRLFHTDYSLRCTSFTAGELRR